jgi:phage head maturation protease
MTAELLTAELPEGSLELLEAAAGEERRRIRLRLLRYGEVGELATGRELLEAGAFEGTDPTRVTIEAGAHGGPLVGVGATLEDVEGVPYLEATIARTTAGEELLELMRAGVYRAASIVYRPIRAASRRRADGVNVRSRVELVRVAVLERGAFPSAEVIAANHSEDALVTDQLDQVPTLDQIGALVRGIVADAIPAPTLVVPAPARTPSVLERASSFSQLLEASLAGDDELVAAVAGSFLEAAAPTELVDGVVADVPPLVRPAWLSRLVGELPAIRPVVAAFGTEGLPDSGMEIDWPTFDGDYTGRVAEQAAEKDYIISRKVTLSSDKTTIKTVAGGLDMSWQVLRRSSPSYREIVMRILATAWALESDKAFGAALVAKGTGTGTYDVTSGEELHGSLLEASAKVDDATGSPATFVLAATDAWLELAKTPGLLPPAYGTQNVGGVAQASTLRVEVSGLPIIRAKALAAGTVIVSNRSAASLFSSGMMTATQDVVARLGTDVAVWSMDAPAVFIPTGIVKLTKAAGA